MTRLPAAFLNRLGPRFGDRLSTADAIRESHGRGEGYSDCHPPDAVLFPESTGEVADIMLACSEYRVPVIPFGAGTSLEGQLAAIHGGVSIDMARMDRIIAVDPGSLDCMVEAGVTREQLNSHLRDLGLFFPLDPGANATLGGMASTRASGTNAVRYGTMRDVVLGLTVVTPRGDIIQTGGRARKSSAGYDLTRLYVGSEGTLGIITELRLRLSGIPESIASGVVQFDRIEDAVLAVGLVIQSGIPIARIELLDARSMGACIAYSKLSEFEARPALFVEFHGSRAAVSDQVDAAAAIFREQGGGELLWADQEEDRRRLWKARHDAYHALRALTPGKDVFVTDACVPISKLADCIASATAEADASGLHCSLIGHVGDGNFHMMLAYDPAAPGEREKAESLSLAIARHAIRLGGTCTGEHGVGLHKREVAALEAGASGEVMRAIKQALDPLGIMNPGKTLPMPPNL